MGGFGAFLVCLAGFLLSLQAVLGIRLKAVAAWAAAAFADDFRSWQKARQELKASVERAPKGNAAVKDAAPATSAPLRRPQSRST